MGDRRLTVAVTGLDARSNPYPGIAVARCLREDAGLDVEVIGLTFDVLATGALSGVFDAIERVSWPREGSRPLLETLVAIRGRRPLDIAVPCLDSEVPAYSQIQGELLAHGVRTLLPSPASVARRTKANLPHLGRLHDIPTPRTLDISGLGGFQRAADAFGYPFVVKGALAGAEIVRDAEEARIACERILAIWGLPVLGQEFLDGEEYDVAGVAWPQGVIHSTASIRKVGLSVDGKAAVAATVKNDRILAAARRVIAALEWRGPFEVEMLETADGTPYLIEVNARFPAWIGCSPSFGVNLPATAVRIALGEDVSPRHARAGCAYVRSERVHVGPVLDLAHLATA